MPRLKPLDFSSYGIMSTAVEQAWLAATFTTGVRDWSKPGLTTGPPLGIWLDYVA